MWKSREPAADGDTCIGGSSVATTWQMVKGESIRVPAAMSSLTKLTALHLHLQDSAKEAALDWIWHLTKLKELKLNCLHKMQIGVSFTRLCLLEILVVAGLQGREPHGSL